MGMLKKSHKKTVQDSSNSIISQNSIKSNIYRLWIEDRQPRDNLRARPAFTIVELLIVVVVIAILAAITIVAYNGITARAKDSALKSDLAITAKKVGLIHAETDAYPIVKPSDIPDYIQYSQTDSGQGFCATASKEGSAFNITQSGTIQTGACSGHTVAGGGAGPATMQSFTSSDCASLAVFTGANAEATVQLTDSRGGTTQTYEVAKLADNKCWMLTNLKLGSTTGTITLTPSDSNVASNFTLPELIQSGGYATTDPQVTGPLPGDSGEGATNYGYLYNWVAATAGETQTSMSSGSGDAPYSICPANWRLPTGYASGEFAMLNAKMENPEATVPSSSGGYSGWLRWRYSGPFKGVSAGMRMNATAQNQGTRGYWWSRTAHATAAHYADALGIDDNTAGSWIITNNGAQRVYSYSIRCILG